MIIFKEANELEKKVEELKQSGRPIGFVPTMGALHEGHLNLLNRSKTMAGITICSIFVNPAQFNDPSDYKNYPANIENDLAKLETGISDLLIFIPNVEAIYPAGTHNLEKYDLGYLDTILEGKYRPGHFQGVCQVMSRLLKMVQPDLLFMGQKDYQQCLVIKRLLKLISMNEKILQIVETVRESDGLAMSSRNMRLNTTQRQKAPAIFQTLEFIRENFHLDPKEKLVKEGRSKLTAAGFKVDYIEIADADSLQPIYEINHSIALVAAYLGDIRLIDNIMLS